MTNPDVEPPDPTDPGEPTPSEFIAICHTSGCTAQGIPQDTWIYPNPPQFPPVWSYVCGACGVRSTDLTPVTASEGNTSATV